MFQCANFLEAIGGLEVMVVGVMGFMQWKEGETEAIRIDCTIALWT